MTDHHHASQLSARTDGRRMTAAVWLVLGAALLAGPAWGQGPRPGATPLDRQNRLHISASDRCPVCAMRPIKYPRFAAALQMQDGTTFYFCSAGCMLKAWLRPDIFLGAASGEVRQPVAQDYFSGQPVDARRVLWISGSDVIGPMGPALVALQQAAHVEAFRRRHGGFSPFGLKELTEDNWQALTGKPFHF
jgi:nitrous oxide reductase accessory protein NosL